MLNETNRAEVVAVGLLRMYGRSGLQRLVRTTAGIVVKVPMTKQDKTARNWMDCKTSGMYAPTDSAMAGGFTAVVWKDCPAYWETDDYKHEVAGWDA